MMMMMMLLLVENIIEYISPESPIGIQLHGNILPVKIVAYDSHNLNT